MPKKNVKEIQILIFLNDFKKAYHDAEMQHYEVNIQNARTGELEARRNYAELEKLKSLVPKAFGKFAVLQEQRLNDALSKSQSTLTNFYGILSNLGVDPTEVRGHVNDALKKGVGVGEYLKIFTQTQLYRIK